MEDSPSRDSQPRQIGAKLSVAIVIPLSAAINSFQRVTRAGVALDEVSLPFLAGSFVAGALFIGLLSFGMGALARRHKKSRFWPTAAWVSVALAVLSFLGNTVTTGSPAN